MCVGSGAAKHLRRKKLYCEETNSYFRKYYIIKMYVGISKYAVVEIIAVSIVSMS